MKTRSKKRQDSMDAIDTFAEHVVCTRYETLPQEAVEATKKQVMDSLAVAIAGSTAQGVGELVDLYRDWGGEIREYGMDLRRQASQYCSRTDQCNDDARMRLRRYP